jgi:diacylglycerol kinase family enzyme
MVHASIPMGILPLGTLNHFARDLGIPTDLEGALAVVVQGIVRSIDVGEVNGRFFVNNSSVGAYPRVVRERQLVESGGRINRWPALLIAASRVLVRDFGVHTELEVDGCSKYYRSVPFVFVGNNRYSLERLFDARWRERLDEGFLSVLSPRADGLWSLARMSWRALRGKLRQAEDFDLWTAPSARLVTRRRTVHVAIDGEVARMKSPLNYRIHQRALRVLVPAQRSS